MPQAQDITAVSVFPIEIYTTILAAIPDPDFLWVTCRPVCSAFKDIVERIFVRQHLKHFLVETTGAGTRSRQATGFNDGPDPPPRIAKE